MRLVLYRSLSDERFTIELDESRDSYRITALSPEGRVGDYLDVNLAMAAVYDKYNVADWSHVGLGK